MEKNTGVPLELGLAFAKGKKKFENHQPGHSYELRSPGFEIFGCQSYNIMEVEGISFVVLIQLKKMFNISLQIYLCHRCTMITDVHLQDLLNRSTGNPEQGHVFLKMML